MKPNKVETTANGLSIVDSELTGKIVATANSGEIAEEIVRRWNYFDKFASAADIKYKGVWTPQYMADRIYQSINGSKDGVGVMNIAKALESWAKDIVEENGVTLAQFDVSDLDDEISKLNTPERYDSEKKRYNYSEQDIINIFENLKNGSNKENSKTDS